ncbi:MAG: sigma-70 family RNA polymerase sigma factor [Bacteroidota bacterium]
MKDGQIIQSIQAGGQQQEQALHFLFDRYQGWIKGAMRKHRLGEEEALDAFSDAILALRKQVVGQKFRGESKLSTYLHTIFQRRCIDLIRKKATHQETVGLDQLAEVSEKSLSVEESLIVGERFDTLMAVMDQLGNPCKQILVDRYFWGYDDMAEIARRAGVKNANTAGSLRYRCMEKLMKLLNRTQS